MIVKNRSRGRQTRILAQSERICHRLPSFREFARAKNRNHYQGHRGGSSFWYNRLEMQPVYVSVIGTASSLTRLWHTGSILIDRGMMMKLISWHD